MFKIRKNFLCPQGSLNPGLLSNCKASVIKIQALGINFLYPRDPVDTSDWPETRKLRVMPKQPTYVNIKPPRMYKMIRLMRGPEKVHNNLLYKGYGVKALLGGRLMFEHFERIRSIVNRKIDEERMFCIWRVDEPWQPLSKRGIGKRLGGGKGSIHHYCTPVKADRIIVELGGDVFKIEAIKLLAPIVEVLPFPARVVSHEELEQEKAREQWIEENNKNPFTMEYVIRNNMGGCHNFISKYDHEWFGKYK